MCAFQQLKILKDNVKNIHCPHVLFYMNQKARELTEEIETIKNLKVK